MGILRDTTFVVAERFQKYSFISEEFDGGTNNYIKLDDVDGMEITLLEKYVFM